MLFHVIPHYSTFNQNICAFLWLFRYFLLPLYHHTNTYQFLNKILAMASGKAESSNYSNFFPKQITIMQQNQCLTMGRTQLAQMYFPYVLPQTAWQKLRSLLNEDPNLAHLAKLRRRTFLPAEVNIIYQHLGQP